MKKRYWIGRKRAAMAMARAATSAEARLIHYDMAGRYSIKAAQCAPFMLVRTGPAHRGRAGRAAARLAAAAAPRPVGEGRQVNRPPTAPPPRRARGEPRRARPARHHPRPDRAFPGRLLSLFQPRRRARRGAARAAAGERPMSLHDWLGTHAADTKAQPLGRRPFRHPLPGLRQGDGEAAGAALAAQDKQGLTGGAPGVLAGEVRTPRLRRRRSAVSFRAARGDRRARSRPPRCARASGA